MPSFNKVIIAGHLTRDPELKYTPAGSPVCNFGLAMNKKSKEGKESVCFVDVTAWGTQGENCNKYLSKGKAALVEGRLNYRTWETQDGQKRSKLDVVAESVTFLGGGDAGEGKRHSKEEEDEIPF